MVHRETETAFDTLHGRSAESSETGHETEDKGALPDCTNEGDCNFPISVA